MRTFARTVVDRVNCISRPKEGSPGESDNSTTLTVHDSQNAVSWELRSL